VKRILSLVALVLMGLTAGNAQTFRGGLTGTVTDASGAAVAGATVTATNTGTGLKRSVETDDTGNYFFNELPLGDYELTASKSGFKTQTVKGARVEVSVNNRVDISLSAGQVTESVEVTADVPLVDTTGNTLGGTIAAREFNTLPVNGRDFTKALTLVPGATADPSAVSDSPGSFGLFSINGNRGRSNNYLLDGTDMNDGYRNLPSINEAGVFGTPATILPLDAVAEMGILSNTEAQYGRNSGAIVNIVTKSGSNSLHGTLFEYFRNNALDARNFFNAKPTAQNVFQNNQFGGSLGGPIIRDKTFFFVAYEGQRENVSLPGVARVPTAAEIATATAANGGVVNLVIAALLARNPWPAPNQAPDANGNNLQVSAPGSNRVDSFIGKLDHQIGKNILTARYFFGDSDQSFPLALVGGSKLPGFNTVTPTTVHVVSLSYTHFVTDRLLAEVRGGYNRFFETFFPQDKTFDPNSIGLTTNAGTRDFGLPVIRVGALSTSPFGTPYETLGANASLPRGRVDTNSQIFTNWSYTRGNHNWKWGYEFRRTSVNGFFDAGYRGVLSFDTLEDFIAGNPAGGRQARGFSQRVTHQNNHSVYVQDNWKLFPNFTLNYGMRWDYFGVISEEKNRFSVLRPGVGLVQVGTAGQGSLYPNDLNNFAPRISFAWDTLKNGRMVLRGGWGVFYDSFSQDFFVGQLPFNTFNPGPAYNGGGPAPIEFSFTASGPLTSGVPVYSGFSDSDAFTVDQKIRTPYVQNYNLNLQYQFTSKMALQVGYVGSTGRKLFRYRDINQQLDPVLGTRPLDALTTPGGTTFFYVNQFESTANSQYNSLQTQYEIRNWRGFTTRIAYTWGHSIDNASDGQDYVAQATQPDNSFNPRAEFADSNFDTRHRFSWIFNYELPKFQPAKWLTNGWSFDGVVSLLSGQPYNLTYQFQDDYNGSGEFFGRPDVTGNPFAGTSGHSALLNLSAFQVPCTYDNLTGTCVPGTQHFGNLRRNAFVGPGFRNFDFAVSKATKLGEKVTMQLRFDFFNIFNHPNFTNPTLPNFAVDFLGNGIDATGHGVGFLGSTATPDVAIGNPFLGGGGPRNIQISMKFSF
jgi:hypothetical protein